MTPDARLIIDAILTDAARRRASDVHLEPTAAGYDVRLRIDGLLETVATHNPATGRSLVLRLMVMARLLTYRLDVPQEGRLSIDGGSTDLRLAIIPTAHGLRAAVRMPADLLEPQSLDALSLPPAVLDGLHRFAAADAGLLIVTGPAGSGKTTTIYALLAHITRTSPGLSVITLEDPVERRLPGVTQIEVSAFGQLTYERALRSLLRHDPQVLMLGEIRDSATASLALQAALSGHRLISTLHAAHPAGAVARLLEMDLEPYQLTSALFGIVAQRLLRRKTAAGYQGRVPVAEFAALDETLRRAILQRADTAALRAAIEAQAGHVTMAALAAGLAARGMTDDLEIRRVLGSGDSDGASR